MREKIHGDARPHALLVAHEEDFLELGQAAAVDGEDDLVDHVLAQQLWKLRQGTHGILAVQLRRHVLGRIGEKAGEPDAVSGGALQFAGELHRGRAQAGDHHIMMRSEFATQDAQHPPGIQPEQAQQNPRVAREQRDEAPAEIQTARVLEQHDRGRAYQALPENVAQDHARVLRVNVVVEGEPISQRDPHQHRPAEQQRFHRGGEKKDVLEFQTRARRIRQLERGADQQNVGKPEQDAHAPVMSPKH